MTDKNPNSDLEGLQSRIDQARDSSGISQAQKNADEGPPKSPLALAFRVGIELVSAVAVGFVIGWLLDSWLETKPWLMLVFILLGGCAGILNVYRMARGFGYSAGYQSDETTTDKTDEQP